MKNFGQTIKEKRQSLKLSLRQICQQVLNDDGDPISVSYLNDIEQSRRNAPSGAIIVQLAKVLTIDKDELLRIADKVDPELEQYLKNPKHVELFRKIINRNDQKKKKP